MAKRQCCNSFIQEWFEETFAYSLRVKLDFSNKKRAPGDCDSFNSLVLLSATKSNSLELQNLACNHEIDLLTLNLSDKVTFIIYLDILKKFLIDEWISRLSALLNFILLINCYFYDLK